MAHVHNVHQVTMSQQVHALNVQHHARPVVPRLHNVVHVFHLHHLIQQLLHVYHVHSHVLLVQLDHYQLV